MFLLILLELFYVFLGPEPNFEAIQRLDRGSFNLALYNPAVESAPTNAEHLCHANCRVRPHQYNEIGLFHLSSTNHSTSVRTESAECRAKKEYRSLIANRRKEPDHR